MSSVSKQSVKGFKVVRYSVKRVKDAEKLVLVLEADIDDVGCGNYNMGDVLGAMLNHRVSDTDVGFALFMNSETSIVEEDWSEEDAG